MPENRFFLDTPFEKGASHLLEDHGEIHHLKVMRKEIGDEIEVVNGRSQLALATLTQIEKRAARLTLNTVTNAPLPSRRLILAQGLLKPKNLDLVIEKGTELGATAFWLFPGERSEKKDLSRNQLDRLHHLTISALKQSGRLDLPQIELLPPLSKWTHRAPNALFGDLEAQSRPTPVAEDTTLFIGPESGFSPAEIALLKTFSAGIRLNSNILRAETAAVAGLALLSLI